LDVSFPYSVPWHFITKMIDVGCFVLNPRNPRVFGHGGGIARSLVNISKSRARARVLVCVCVCVCVCVSSTLLSELSLSPSHRSTGVPGWPLTIRSFSRHSTMLKRSAPGSGRRMSLTTRRMLSSFFASWTMQGPPSPWEPRPGTTRPVFALSHVPITLPEHQRFNAPPNLFSLQVPIQRRYIENVDGHPLPGLHSHNCRTICLSFSVPSLNWHLTTRLCTTTSVAQSESQLHYGVQSVTSPVDNSSLEWNTCFRFGCRFTMVNSYDSLTERRWLLWFLDGTTHQTVSFGGFSDVRSHQNTPRVLSLPHFSKHTYPPNVVFTQ